MQPNKTEPKWILWLEWAVVLMIIALATFLRYWRIGEVPPGLNSDEAVGAMGALTTLREGLRYSYEGQGGGGVLGFYFAAAFFYLFGPSIATIRGLAAWAGVMSIFANYWAIREMFRLEGLNRARVIATLSTLGLATSLWHISASRIAFAGIGVPFLMLPSVYFLWRGLNKPITNKKSFIASGFFLGSLLYIYLSGVFVSPLYAAFFIAQWLILLLLNKLNIFQKAMPQPPTAYLTTQFWNLVVVATVAIMVILPIITIVLTRPELEPGTTRVSQAFFMNPEISQGDPWGLLWRSFVGNFAAYGVSFSWLWGQPPRMVAFIPHSVGLIIFLGFLISLWYSLRGRAAYLFTWLWFVIMLFPGILSPDVIPHNLRTIGATTPTYMFAAITLVWFFDMLNLAWNRWIQPKLNFASATYFLLTAYALLLIWQFAPTNWAILHDYFYIYPNTNDAKAAYHVYAVEMAKVINQETNPDVAFILPRNTAAGDVFRNFTTDFLVELAQPPAAHYWVIDDETTLPDDLTKIAKSHHLIRVVRWKTSKHTGADPKKVMPYYLEKYGHYEQTDSFEYFDIDSYRLEVDAPDFRQTEKLSSTQVDFDSIQLTAFALGNAAEASKVNLPQVSSNDLLWLRVNWLLKKASSENLKVSVLVYSKDGQLITQVDKLLQNNGLQVATSGWQLNSPESTYFLIPIPLATPPGSYLLDLAVYEEGSLKRLAPSINSKGMKEGKNKLLELGTFVVTSATKPLNPDDLPLAFPACQELLPGIILLGFETLPGETVLSGHEVGASLIWQAGKTAISDDIQMSLVAKVGNLDVNISHEESNSFAPPDSINSLNSPTGLAGDYPTSKWQSGEILRGWLKARIPPTFAPGLYKLRLRLTSVTDPEKELFVLPIGDFHVKGWPRNFTAPTPQLNIGANFGGQTTLLGFDTETMQIKAGQSLKVRLYWRGETEFTEDYKSFVHFIGPDGLLYGQVDQTPGAGDFPTIGWLPNETITDAYSVPIAANAPPGNYQIEIGLYNPNTGERLPLHCNLEVCDSVNNRVLLKGVTGN